MTRRIYLGYKVVGNVQQRTIFHADKEPTEMSHGEHFAVVVGPFRTMRGATFMRDYGQGNPHCRCVAEAEKLGKLYEGE